jgi:hypothetical protein
LPTAPISQIVAMLSASIAPVIVISGVGLLLLSMTNRYGRVIDRARELDQELDVVANHQRRGVIVAELRILFERAQLLRRAIILNSVSVLFVTLTVLSLFAAQALAVAGDFVAVPFFGLGLLTLIASLYYFIRELGLSLKALELEIGRHL